MDKLIEKFVRYTPVEFEREYAKQCAIIALEHTIEALQGIKHANYYECEDDIQEEVEKYQEQLKQLRDE